MRNQRGWTSLLGWAIFGLVLAGGPILNIIQNITGVQFPSFTLPVIIAVLMLVSAIASVGRVARGDQSNVPPLPPAADGANLPRFGAPPMRMPPPSASPPTLPFPSDAVPPPMARPDALNSPRFEPVINLPVILLGSLGLIVLGVLAFAIFGNP